MRSRTRRGCAAALAAAATLVAAGLARASDPPHWQSAGGVTIDCTSACHTLHTAAGGQLTAAAGNVNLCLSCHSPAGMASSLPISQSDLAVPGVSGSSHAFDRPAVNASAGAAVPQQQAMALRVMTGNVVCSTCHNQHQTAPVNGGTPRIAPARRITALGSTGTVTSGGAYTGAGGFWYLIEIQTPGIRGTATFRWSKDNGVSWMAQNVVTAATNALDNGVTIFFSGSGTFDAGERWEFSASRPFLRVAMDAGDNAAGSRLCRDCHRDWAMDHSAVETWTGTFRSHPVGVALGANGHGYDRAVPLDGNGAIQGGAGADANATNDYLLDAGGRVQCLSCHAPHYADSNTLTVDGP